MCVDPVTLGIIATTTAVAGAGISAYSAYTQNQYRSKVAAQNSRLESARAAAEITAGQKEREQLQRKYAGLAGGQRAAMAANGIDVSFGSADQFSADTYDLYREDEATALANNAAKVKGIDISAANYTSESRAASMAATGALVGGAFDIGSSVLGGIGRTNKIKAAQRAGGSGWSGF